MGFIDSFYDVMEVEAGFLKYCMELLAREYSEDLKRLEVELPRVDRIPCVRFDEPSGWPRRSMARPSGTL